MALKRQEHGVLASAWLDQLAAQEQLEQLDLRDQRATMEPMAPMDLMAQQAQPELQGQRAPKVQPEITAAMEPTGALEPQVQLERLERLQQLLLARLLQEGQGLAQVLQILEQVQRQF
jgi:hypothetical protein